MPTPVWCNELTDIISRQTNMTRLHLIDLRMLGERLAPHVNEGALKDLMFIPSIAGPGHEYDMDLVREQLRRFTSNRATWNHMPQE